MRIVVVTVDNNTINSYFPQAEFINVGQSIHSRPFSFVFVTKLATEHKLYKDWFETVLKPRFGTNCTLIEER